MKIISLALKAHLSAPVTTLATCWRLVRTDGTQFAFTSFDEDLDVDGITYVSTAGFARTAIQTNSNGEVDNLDVLGFFQDDAVTERDLKNGLFDYATIYLFAVNWTNLGEGIIRLRRGWLGETTLSPAGIFHAELRGLTQALVQEFGDEYMPICRADLGDSKCKIPIIPPDWQPDVSISQGEYRRPATRDDDDHRVAIFMAQNGGTSGTDEPDWDTPIGHVTSDNGINWESKPYWRGIFTVQEAVNQKQFICAGMSVPAGAGDVGLATNGYASFQRNIAAGTNLIVSDGVVTHTAGTAIDLGWQEAAQYFYAVLLTSPPPWQMDMLLQGGNIFFTNRSGQQGDIQSLGDTQRAIVIHNFLQMPFDGGTLTWITGDNSGRSMELKTYDQTSGMCTLWLSMNYPIAVGDKYYLYPGCDKRRDTCLYTFNNINNFRGEPDMPMFDKVLSYPDA